MYEKCEATESAKWLANLAHLSDSQRILVHEVLPILERDTENDDKWTEYLDGEALWQAQYFAGKESKNHDGAYRDAYNKASESFPHAEFLQSYEDAYTRLYALMYDAFVIAPDEVAYCKSVAETDKYCLSVADFYVSAIKDSFKHTETDARLVAAEVCNTRGLY